MKIASIQLNIKWHNQAANLDKAKQLVERAASNSCELIIFPEMFNSGYSMDSEAICESLDGETVSTLCNLARLNKINIIAGVAIQASAGESPMPENKAVFINSVGQVASQYTKNYPFSLAGEKQVYATGEQPSIFQLGEFMGTCFICYDLRFPELFRKVAKEVDIIVVIASWPSTRQHHWELLLQARAIENQCFVIGVNRIGDDANQLNYNGGSMVCDPMGGIVSRAGRQLEYIETIIDLSKTKQIRKQFPFLQDIKTPNH